MSTLPSPIPKLQHAPLPLKCCELGNVPQLLTWTHIGVLQGVGGASATSARCKCNAKCQPFPFSSYREKGERRLSSGTRANVGDSPRKHTGPVPVHPWQRAWFMAWDPGLRGETGLRHRPGLILTPAIPHTWVPGFFLPFGSDRRHPSK